MTKFRLTRKQTQFLRLLSEGQTVVQAMHAVGHCRTTAWYWAKRNPEFAQQLKAIYPRFGAISDAKQEALPLVEVETSLLSASGDSLHQLAMQRLAREIRTDGPNAVLASAAVILGASQAVPAVLSANAVDVALESAVTQAEEQTSPPLREAPMQVLTRMVDEVFSSDQPNTYEADTCTMRYCIERFFDVDLSAELSCSGFTLGAYLARIASEKFEVMPRHRKHRSIAKTYLMPVPKISR